jgi:tRNA-dihydrouridine synthase B
MLSETGCAGVSIGRGAFYDPWIFRRTLHYLKGRGTENSRGTDAAETRTLEGCATSGELLPESTFEERVRVMCRHLDLMIEVFGEESGCRMFRKVAPWYSRRFGPANEFNRKVVRISSRAGFYEVLDGYLGWRRQFLDERGELLPRFRPAPLTASFLQEPGSPARQQIPVPKGPVEVW